MVSFYDFLKKQWGYPCRANIAESLFAALRPGIETAKRFKTIDNTTAVMWGVLKAAERTFWRRDAPQLLKDACEGVEFVNGVAIKDREAVA